MSRTEAELPTAAELWRQVIEQLDLSDRPPEEDEVVLDRTLPGQTPLRTGGQHDPTALRRAAVNAANAITNLASMLDVDIEELSNERAIDAWANLHAHSHTLRLLALDLKALAERSGDSREH